MKVLFLNILIITLFGFLDANAQSSRAIYVSVHGHDKNIGDEKKPLSTIQEGINRVKEIKKTKFKGKVELVIGVGTYYLDKSIKLDQSFSGKQNTPFVLRAEDGEKVILSAGILLQNLKWKSETNGVWSTVVPSATVIEDLYSNGKRLIKARYPNYNANILPFNGYAADAISKERVARWKNPKGGYVHALHEGKWGGFHFEIKGKDSQGNLMLEGGQQNNRPSPIHETFRFVENIFEELDDTNEWYFDINKSILYYKPEQGTNPNVLKFETARLENIISLVGTKQQPVRNIKIKGLDFVCTAPTFMKTSEPLLRSDWTIYRQGAVKFENAENCEVSQSNFYNLGGNAVFVSNYNREVKISGNLIEQIGASAVSFVGDPSAVRSPSFRYENFVPEADLDTVRGPKSDNYPKDCEVSDNLIRNIGLVEKQVAGVQISIAESIRVLHNTIYDIPRAGINVGDGTWGGHDIAYNDVFNTVLETSDHGAFNSWGRDRFWHPDREKMDDLVARRPELILLDAYKTTYIRNNRFRCDHGWDIDLDDGSSNYVIFNNLCLNGGIKLREGFHRTVYNNITVNNGFHPHVWFKNSHDVFRNNIVMLPHQDIRVDFWGDTVDYNYYVKAEDLVKDQEKRLERNGKVITPKFKDVKNGDFTLLAEVPDGFVNFDMQNFGVTSGRLKKLADSPIIPELNYNKPKTNTASSVITYKGATLKSIESLGEQSAAGLPTMEGIMIVKFADDSYLKYNGFLINDVIVACEGEKVINTTGLDSLLKQFHYYHKLNFTIYRNQVKQEVVLNL
ncbi:right-handed parallel beta-helix repeat-containing protein [Sphingobacterium bovistauri]|uniref:Right-handed parallel beta-helix repeat-containing protein n=1 Tax=Sphingobacterium bovistauri TaxID=2781959 RepID=A0ABS7Z250_9SPHI|nr:peptide-binding protein [Sphingobacterium bovistauri]MCA5004251.1 right-handed parallel beta-helix repeat-containing protein [Sphingobacterium bovistauri]